LAKRTNALTALAAWSRWVWMIREVVGQSKFISRVNHCFDASIMQLVEPDPQP